MNGKERAELRARANGIETILYVGRGGIGDNLVSQLNGALETRELVKGRVLPGCELTVREVCDQLAALTGSEQIQVIGTRFVLYRKSEKLAEMAKAAKARAKKAAESARTANARARTRVSYRGSSEGGFSRKPGGEQPHKSGRTGEYRSSRPGENKSSQTGEYKTNRTGGYKSSRSGDYSSSRTGEYKSDRTFAARDSGARHEGSGQPTQGKSLNRSGKTEISKGYGSERAPSGAKSAGSGTARSSFGRKPAGSAFKASRTRPPAGRRGTNSDRT